MGFKALAWAAEAKCQTSKQKLVLLLLAQYAGDDGKCWPSLASLCDQGCMSKNTVLSAISGLKGLGLITVESRVIDGSKASNVYYLKLNQWFNGCTRVVQPLHQGGSTIEHKSVIESVNESTNSDEQVVAAGKTGLSSQQVIDLYHQELPSCRRVKVWTKAREHALRARLKEDRQRLDPEWWRALFQYCSGQDFLMAGQWFDLEWLLRPTNFAKLVEGRYENA